MISAMPSLTSRGAPLAAALARQRARIYRHVRSLVKSAGDAEDLTQETLLRAQEQLGTLEDPAALEAWLLRIATNMCTDFLRGAARRDAAPREEEEQGLAEAMRRPGADALLDRARMSSCGEALLRRLPDGQRRVLVMHDFLGLTSAEIARALRCTSGAVKIRLHRARRQFRAELEEACDFHVDECGALVGGPKPRRRGGPA